MDESESNQLPTSEQAFPLLLVLPKATQETQGYGLAGTLSLEPLPRQLRYFLFLPTYPSHEP
jgi:hypothetical protein